MSFFGIKVCVFVERRESFENPTRGAVCPRAAGGHGDIAEENLHF